MNTASFLKFFQGTAIAIALVLCPPFFHDFFEAPGTVAYGGSSNVDLCHFPDYSNDPTTCENKTVSSGQKSTHLSHGDYLGDCSNPCVYTPPDSPGPAPDSYLKQSPGQGAGLPSNRSFRPRASNKRMD